MAGNRVSRRDFVRGSGALTGMALSRLGPAGLAAAAAGACSRRDSGAGFTTLSAAEARELDAVSARILPTTDTPGAREAGVVYFMDRVLGRELADMLEPLQAGLAGFQQGIAAAYPGAGRYSDLDEADQDRWLAANENGPFFGMVRILTLFGFFAMESYGGNRDRVGWKLIGFEGHGAWQPPFGYYDANYTDGDGDDA